MTNFNPFRIALLVFVIGLCVVAISAQDSGARLLGSTPFVLSPEAEAAGIDGKIAVVAAIDKAGVASNIRVFGQLRWPCGQPVPKEMDDTIKAIKANVAMAKFAPAIKDGKPRDSEVRFYFAVGQAYKDMLNEREKAARPKPAIDRSKMVESGVINGRAIRLAKPDYPASARPQRIGGVVTVQVMVDESGKVYSAGVVEGHPVFYTSTRNAACDSKFSPTSLAGSPVKVSGVITYNFSLGTPVLGIRPF
jgi:TonB family protein